MSENQDESKFEECQMFKMRMGICCIYFGFACPLPFLCVGCCLMKNANQCNPSDARKLSEDEAKPYIDGLQGGSME